MNDMLRIKNLNKFAKHIGKSVAMDAGFDIQDLKKYISVKNIKGIIYQYSEMDEQGNRLISEDMLNNICSDIFEWLIGVDLARMASEDIIDCAWDSEHNCMVFSNKKGKKWQKDM